MIYWWILIAGITIGSVAYVIARLSYLYGYHRGWILGAMHVSNQIMSQRSEDDIEDEEEARPH